MKRIPKILTPRPPTAGGDDAFGRGMDVALTILVFFGAGYGLDRWLGTTPWFMIALTVLAAVGFFYSFKYRYEARMEQLEAQRAARAAGEGPR